MLDPPAPQTQIVLNPVADLTANRAFGVGDGASLPPLVIDDACVVFGHDVLAVRFSELGVPAYLVDDDPTFSALQNVGEESVGEFVAEIAEIE